MTQKHFKEIRVKAYFNNWSQMNVEIDFWGYDPKHLEILNKKMDEINILV